MTDLFDRSARDRLVAIDHENPSKKTFDRLVASMDMYAAEGIRNHRAGRSPNLREMGFTELADVLGM